MSELTSYRQLTNEEADLFLKDMTIAEQLCPGGEIIRDDAPGFANLHRPERSEFPDLKSIKIHERQDSEAS